MLGRILLTIDSILLVVGAPIADYGPTHMFNPNWPPHAKFHNGQTINLSLLLGLATLFYTWRGAATPELKREFMLASAFTGSIYWIAGICSILYPGTMGLDPEFGGPGFPQAPLFAFAAVCALAGSWLEASAGKVKAH
ncbi:hypothetical protein GQX73_g5041 [Xylaria multiplex]|uniref:Acetyltransferase n=1 Tax=Xylaria multiplex TaxID=323545 RepID=A0A7C8MUT1_9PEZI|nr:hypothetical protein GQX73_g5041 [Xylaria multiplex]